MAYNNSHLPFIAYSVALFEYLLFNIYMYACVCLCAGNLNIKRATHYDKALRTKKKCLCLIDSC